MCACVFALFCSLKKCVCDESLCVCDCVCDCVHKYVFILMFLYFIEKTRLRSGSFSAVYSFISLLSHSLYCKRDESIQMLCECRNISLLCNKIIGKFAWLPASVWLPA